MKNAGEPTTNLTNGLCDDCYMEENEGPCGCFKELDRFK